MNEFTTLRSLTSSELNELRETIHAQVMEVLSNRPYEQESVYSREDRLYIARSLDEEIQDLFKPIEHPDEAEEEEFLKMEEKLRPVFHAISPSLLSEGLRPVRDRVITRTIKTEELSLYELDQLNRTFGRKK